MSRNSFASLGCFRFYGFVRANCGLRTTLNGLVAADLVQIVEPNEHVPRLAAVRRPEDPGQLELVDDAGCAAIADAHAPLQQGGGADLVVDAHLGGLAE